MKKNRGGPERAIAKTELMIKRNLIIDFLCNMKRAIDSFDWEDNKELDGHI